MKLLTFTATLFLLLTVHIANGQAWQWAKTGGGTFDNNSIGFREEVSHLATDKHNNIYGVSRVVNSSFLVVDGQPIILPSNTDATLIFSYTCDGTFRWGKVVQLKNVTGLATDTLGGVYISGNILSNSFFLGSLTNNTADTFFDIMSNDMKALALVKLDTMGNKQWIRTPQPDTVSWNSPQSSSMDMDVEPDGTIHWMCGLRPGNYQGNSLILTDGGTHVLRYSAGGALTGNTLLALSTPPGTIATTTAWLNYSKNNNRYIVTGSFFPGNTPLTIGDTVIDRQLFIASFNGTTGNVNWVNQAGIFAGLHTKSQVDATNNIYLSGLLGHGYSFNGFTLNNSYTTIPNQVAFIQKMDADGNALWSYGANATSQAIPLGMKLSGTEVAIAGSYGSKFGWENGNDSFFTNSSSTGVNVFLSRFNSATGNYIKTDTFSGSTPGAEYPYSLVADKNNNLYVGGRFESNIMINGTSINSAGGSNDFFLAKFGTANCDTIIPANIIPASVISSLSVYPNPTDNTATITLLGKPATDASITIMNMMGQVVVKVTHQAGNSFTIDLSSQANGMYFIELREANNLLTGKLIKR